MTRSLILAGALAGLVSSVADAAPAAPQTWSAIASSTMQSDPGLALPVACQDLTLVAAYLAVEGPTGITTIPMAETGPSAFVMARHADWPATGHIRLLWAPTASAPTGLLSVLDVGADPVLMDGMIAAEALSAATAWPPRFGTFPLTRPPGRTWSACRSARWRRAAAVSCIVPCRQRCR